MVVVMVVVVVVVVIFVFVFYVAHIKLMRGTPSRLQYHQLAFTA